VVFAFRLMTLAELHEVNGWRWSDVVFDRPALETHQSAYATRDEAGSIAAYCSFGQGSRLGLDSATYIAVSGGLRPDLVDGGNGRRFMAAVLALGRREFSGQTVAGVVKDSNQRSLKSVLGAGFVVLRRADDDKGMIVIDACAAAAKP
jgi:hypothetical protein